MAEIKSRVQLLAESVNGKGEDCASLPPAELTTYISLLWEDESQQFPLEYEYTNHEILIFAMLL